MKHWIITGILLIAISVLPTSAQLPNTLDIGKYIHVLLDYVSFEGRPNLNMTEFISARAAMRESAADRLAIALYELRQENQQEFDRIMDKYGVSIDVHAMEAR